MFPGSQPDHGGKEGRSYPPQLLQVLERAHVQRLKELNLNNTELEYVPEYIGNLTTLTSLNLSGAQIIKALLILLLLDCRKYSPSLKADFKCITV